MSSPRILPFLLSALLSTPSASAQTEEPAHAPSPQTPTAGHDGHFFIQSPDGINRIQFDGFVQPRFEFTGTDRTPATSDTPEVPASQKGAFLLARARFGLGGHVLAPGLSYRVQIGLARGNVDLLDYYLDYALHPQLHVRIGQDRMPFSRPLLFSSTKLQLVDVCAPSKQFAAGRDIGVLFHNDYLKSEGFEYAVGLYNGTGAAPHFDGERFNNVPERMLPRAVLRLGHNFGTTDGYTPSDFRSNGAPALAIAASLASDLDARAASRGELQAEADLSFKAHGLGSSAGFYASLQKNGDTFSDRADPKLGAYGQLGYVILKRIEPAVRVMWLKDQQARTEEGAGTLGLNAYFFERSFKWQNDGTVFLDALEGQTTGYLLRSQVQLAF